MPTRPSAVLMKPAQRDVHSVSQSLTTKTCIPMTQVVESSPLDQAVSSPKWPRRAVFVDLRLGRHRHRFQKSREADVDLLVGRRVDGRPTHRMRCHCRAPSGIMRTTKKIGDGPNKKNLNWRIRQTKDRQKPSVPSTSFGKGLSSHACS